VKGCSARSAIAITGMQQVAVGWLVYRLTHSAFLLGLTGFIGLIPTFIITPFAGVLADRANRHRLLLLTQVLAMVQAGFLAALVLSGNASILPILLLSFFLGVINSFDMPVRHAFTVEMIEDRAHLGNAIALNSSLVNMARIVGPSIAGLIIALFGEGICFLLNALSYIAVIYSLQAMRFSRSAPRPPSAPVMEELRKGVVYVWRLLPIRYVLLFLGLNSLAGVAYQVLMPVFVRDIFHGGPHVLGFLVAMSGVGALVGALYLARRPSVLGLGRIMVVTSAVFGAATVAFSFSRLLGVSMIILVVTGFSMMVQMAASNTVLQTIADDEKRGRVMSFFTMAFMGTAPFGSLLAGGCAHLWGAPVTVASAGAVCCLGAFLFARQRPCLREAAGQGDTPQALAVRAVFS
jgi:MFS family permease